MKAVVKTRREYGAAEVLDYPDPPAPVGNEVTVAVKSSAICGSDVHSYEYIPSSHFMQVPVIMGHEFSGVVTAVGPDVKDFQVGQRVMGESNKYCGACPNCRVGKTNVCTNSVMRGITGDGAMCGILNVNEQYLHHLDDNISFDDAAVAQPVSVSVHGVFDNCTVMPGDNVVVFGPGIIGQSAAQLAKSQGAANVFLVGTAADAESRLPAAKEAGLIPINAQETPVQEFLKDYLGTDQVDVAIECSGAPVALNACIQLVRKSGCLTILSIFPKPSEVDITTMVRKELNVRTSYTCTWKNYETALALMADGTLRIGSLCKAYPVEDAVRAFEDAVNKTVLKPILHF